jgi:hypothetical protein
MRNLRFKTWLFASLVSDVAIAFGERLNDIPIVKLGIQGIIAYSMQVALFGYLSWVFFTRNFDECLRPLRRKV